MRSMGIRQLSAAILGLAMLAGCAKSGGLPYSYPDSSATVESPSGAYATAEKYVVTFYPLWFTHAKPRPRRRTEWSARIAWARSGTKWSLRTTTSFYGSTYLYLDQEPVVLTIPTTRATWSMLLTDAYGDVYDAGISASGAYAFTGPGWSGTLPAGVTQVKMPTNFSNMIIRSDKYSAAGQDQKAEAQKFRSLLAAETLSEYETNPPGPHTKLYPLAAYSFPFKTHADNLIASDPMKFLKALQKAVASSNTPPLNKADQALSNAFDAYFDASNPDTAALSAGTRKAHAMIVDAYLSNTGKTKWITFSTIGTTWSALVRSAITEYIQYGNSHATAAYYQTFDDGSGKALDASTRGYVLTFRKNQIPQAKRFWSLTCYIPDSITLYKNALQKYLVASYTPGLQKGKDGSVSIYMSPQQPKGVPACQLAAGPEGRVQCDVLRVYGPEGTVDRVRQSTRRPPSAFSPRSRSDRRTTT